MSRTGSPRTCGASGSGPRTPSPPRVGIARDSPERIQAGLAYTLSEAADDGHCYLPAPNLIAGAAKILDVPADLIGPCLDDLAAAEGVVRETVPAQPGAAPQVPAVYLPPFYQAERALAHALLRLHATPTIASPPSPRSTGTRRCAGYAAAPAPTSPPGKPTPCGSP